MKNETKQQNLSAKEAFLQVYKLGVEYRERVFDLFNAAFGEWDGISPQDIEQTTRTEAELCVFERIFNPTLEHLRTRAFEEYDGEILRAMK